MNGEERYFGLYLGYVVNNVDPKGLNRVTLEVPGLIEPESGWAIPVRLGADKQRGVFSVPKKKSGAIVAFVEGDPDRPVYLGGWYAEGEALSPVSAVSPEDATKLTVLQTDTVTVSINDKAGAVKVVASGPVVLESPSIRLGAGATSPAVVGGPYLDAEDALLTALNTFLTAFTTYATAIKSIADPSGTATTAMGAAVTAMQGAISTFKGGAADYRSSVVAVK